MKPIIEIKNIGKCYKLGEAQPYLALRDVFAGLFKRKPARKDFWALRDVSFSVAPGETVGIIGSNGAGKSTLLKILSRITPPTEGEAILHGRTASLLEVGTGFNPELTGRENIYLNGAILGMTKAEIATKFEQIVEFSGIGQFLDTPVKRYSSGMYVRLAFAVAAHLEPEILIVDEVLAVGDAAFQKKCLGKMGDVARGGRTVLFVSHNMGAVKQLCQRCVWLEGGEVIMIGDAEEVVNKYLGENRSSDAVNVYPENLEKQVQIRKISVLNSEHQPSVHLDVAQDFRVELEYDIRADIEKNNYVCVSFRDQSQNLILQSFDVDSNREYYDKRDRGKYRVVFEFPGGLFNKQNISLDVMCGIPPKYNPEDSGREFFDEVRGINVELLKGQHFSNNFFGGGRGGTLLTIFKSNIWKL